MSEKINHIRTQLTLYFSREKKEEFKKAIRSRGWRTITSFLLALASDAGLIKTRNEWLISKGIEPPEPPVKKKRGRPGNPENLRPKQYFPKNDKKD